VNTEPEAATTSFVTPGTTREGTAKEDLTRLMRRRGIGLLGVAAVAGTAAYAGKKSAEGAAREQQEQQAIADLQQQNAALAQQQQQLLMQQQAAAAPAATAAPASGIDMQQLKQLGDLHAAGVLTDEEFAAAKAKLLGAS
jgi:hypothetical protein